MLFKIGICPFRRPSIVHCVRSPRTHALLGLTESVPYFSPDLKFKERTGSPAKRQRGTLYICFAWLTSPCWLLYYCDSAASILHCFVHHYVLLNNLHDSPSFISLTQERCGCWELLCPRYSLTVLRLDCFGLQVTWPISTLNSWALSWYWCPLSETLLETPANVGFTRFIPSLCVN